jgi:hypothetical protein
MMNQSHHIGRDAPKRSEHVEAVTLMRVVKLHEAKYPNLRLLFAVPNGGDRNKIVAAKMKAEGVKPGVPDYMLPVSSPGYLGLAIELKSMTGYASTEQKQWIADLRAAGWKAEVCRGWSLAWDVIQQYVEAKA